MFGFDDPFGNKKDSGRDPRRAFSQTQKTKILHQQNYKCAACHRPLDLRIVQYDHHKPWADKGRTVSENGRALHPDCHALKTHEDRAAQQDGKKKAPAKKQPESPFGDLFGTGSTGKRKKSSSDPFGLTPPKKGKGGFGLF
jgi:hypothetical protein